VTSINATERPADSTLPAPTREFVLNDREREHGEVGGWIAYTNLPAETFGHVFTSPFGDGLVDGAIVVMSGYDINQFSAHNAFSCSNCDAYPSFDFFDDPERGPRLVYANRVKDNDGALACPAADGVEWTVDLAVPSGRMIVSDDLRPVYHVPLRHERDVPDYNSALGQMLHCKEQEAIGCAFGPTSNIALGLFRPDDQAEGEPVRYEIVTCFDDAEPGEEGYYAGTEMADICTDLWAYSVADLADFTARADALVMSPGYENPRRWDNWTLSGWIASGADPADLPEDYAIVDVEPGTYRFHHLGNRADFDEDGTYPLIWATITRVGDASGPEA
jgi:hypothetical protein